MVRTVAGVTIVGAPTSAGAYAPGQEDGPAALREHGLLDALRTGGLDVTDAGDVERFRWRPDPLRPRAANADAVAACIGQIAERVAGAPAGDRVVVLGGDCTTGIGTVTGLARRGRAPALVYFDRHADLNVPGTTIDGALDWMGVAHMLGIEGAVPEVAGERPLLAPDRLVFLALVPPTAREQAVIDRLALPAVGMEDAVDDPQGAAGAALAALPADAAIAVHFDVDVLDFLEVPLAENTDRAPGLPLAAAATALATLLADPRVAALTVTEFNPHHGDAATTRRLVDVLARALTTTGPAAGARRET